PPAFGPPPTTAPAARSLLSTNSLFATIWNGCAGPKPRLALNFRPKLSPLRAPNTGRLIASWPGANWISKPGPHKAKNLAESANVKDQLEGLVNQMVERGILFDEAVGEFEKRFIKRVLDRTAGNQSRAAEVLGIHRNTLSRKIGEYKLDSNGHRRSAR